MSDPTSDLAKRLLTAVVLIPAVLWLIVAGGLPFLLGVMAFIVLGQREFYTLIEGKGAQPLVGLGLGTGLVIPVLAYYGNEYHTMLLMTALLLMLMIAQLGKAQISEALASISGTFFGVFYVSWLFSHTVLLRQIGDAGIDGAERLGLVPDSGIFMLLFAPVVVISSDTGAYFTGRAWGRRKLAPHISPSKSVEGALGGIVAGIAAGALLKLIFAFAWPDLAKALPWVLVVPLGIALAIVGIIGDLVESLLKRDAAVKDAGALLPGMGGVLDRIDSPLLAIPLMYYMMLGYFFLA